MATAAIIGGAGYAGAELIRLLDRHPSFDLRVVTSDADAGMPVADVYPALEGIVPDTFSPHDDPAALECDAAFLAVPHTAGMKHARRLVEAGVAVIDLSADFRLPLETYEAAYRTAHTCPDLLAQAAFGQPELNRDALDEMHDRRIAGFPVIVGCAGCFPTAVALAAAPALRAGLIDLAFPVIADCLSGVSGAGRKPTARTSFCTANESMEAYGLPRHRHEPEMEMELSLALPRDPGDDRPGCPPSRADAPGLSASAPKTPQVMFTPHLVPLSRGMIATVHLRLGSHADPTRFRRSYEDAYASSPFVRVLKEGASPRRSSVMGTNDARIGLFPDRKDGWATAVCAIDNLGKGAAGQAVQVANIVFGFDESEGLLGLARAL